MSKKHGYLSSGWGVGADTMAAGGIWQIGRRRCGAKRRSRQCGVGRAPLLEAHRAEPGVEEVRRGAGNGDEALRATKETRDWQTAARTKKRRGREALPSLPRLGFPSPGKRPNSGLATPVGWAAKRTDLLPRVAFLGACYLWDWAGIPAGKPVSKRGLSVGYADLH